MFDVLVSFIGADDEDVQLKALTGLGKWFTYYDQFCISRLIQNLDIGKQFKIGSELSI